MNEKLLACKIKPYTTELDECAEKLTEAKELLKRWVQFPPLKKNYKKII